MRLTFTRLLSFCHRTTSSEPSKGFFCRQSLFTYNKINGCFECKMTAPHASYVQYVDPKAAGRDEQTALGKLKPQNYDFLLVLDFEATCEDGTQINPQEIIEFPVLKVNTKTLQTDAVFHQYVQPKVHKELTPFCIRLTGILQDMVDDQPYLEDTLKSFHEWMKQNGLFDPGVKFLFVTCGDWDLNKMLPKQCGYFGIPVPPYLKSWLNIKKAFAEVTMMYPKGMMPMIEKLGLTHTGRHHSGIDDCKNIANVMCELLRRGYMAKQTGSMP